MVDTQSLLLQCVPIAEALIRCPSVTPEDHGAQQVIGDRLRAIGFTVTTVEHEGVKNLWAEIGGPGPLFVYAGHTDVVPTGELSSWTTPPFAPSIRNGMLYGRGASDMKGNVACFTAAIEAYIHNHGAPKSFTLCVMLAGDEEASANGGTPALLRHLQSTGRTIHSCIMAEPSSSKTLGDTIRVGRRGSLTGNLTVRGVQGHSAYPEKAKNPIHLVLAALDELRQIEWDRGSEHFPPTTLQITNLNSGTGATNVIPGILRASVNIRFSNLHTRESLQARCEEVFRKATLDFDITWAGEALPFLTSQGALTPLVSDVVKKRVGVTPDLSTGGGTSDARFIAGPGIQVLELGLINATVHQIDEHVSVDDMIVLSGIYLEILERFSPA